MDCSAKVLYGCLLQKLAESFNSWETDVLLWHEMFACKGKAAVCLMEKVEELFH